MTAKCHYETLGVAKDVDRDGLKKAYRKLAMQYHPDRNPGDAKAEEKFRAVAEAYEVLKDNQKRTDYDRDGSSPQSARGGGASGWPSPEDFWGGAGDELWTDLQEAMRRTRSQASRTRHPPEPAKPARRRRPSGLVFSLSLEEAWQGGRRDARIDIPRACPCCRGAGTKQTCMCTRCGGSGRIRLLPYQFGMSAVCFACGGAGHTVNRAAAPCRECSGSGTIVRTLVGIAAVRPGVQDGEQGSFVDIGGAVHSLTFVVRKSRRFDRRGDDLLTTRAVQGGRALNGTTLTVLCIDGRKRRLRVPPGAADRTVFRVPGLGMPRRQGGVGDLFVRISTTHGTRK